MAHNRLEMRIVVAIICLCGILTIQATPSRPSQSPFFDVRNGVLVPKNNNSSNVKANNRIVGGEEAIRGSAPWMASLQWGIIRSAHFCGKFTNKSPKVD